MKGKCFKPYEIEATVGGLKTSFREVIKPQPKYLKGDKYSQWFWCKKNISEIEAMQLQVSHAVWWDKVKSPRVMTAFAPYQVGETVYIKEAYQVRGGDYSTQTAWIVYPDGIELKRKIPMYYSWDKATKSCYQKLDGSLPVVSPLFMPEWAARYFIVITDVRAERLQEITEKDAIKEGCRLIATSRRPYSLYPTPHFTDIERPFTYRDHFIGTWDSIHEKDYPWESNPWVFPYTFRLKETK